MQEFMSHGCFGYYVMYRYINLLSYFAYKKYKGYSLLKQIVTKML